MTDQETINEMLKRAGLGSTLNSVTIQKCFHLDHSRHAFVETEEPHPDPHTEIGVATADDSFTTFTFNIDGSLRTIKSESSY